MPVFLGKEFLVEYLTHQSQFLQSSLLIVPSHLDNVVDYVHSNKDKKTDHLQNILKGCVKEDTVHSTIDELFNEALTHNSKYVPVNLNTTLEVYDVNSTQNLNTSCRNLIAMDSDSDSGLLCSFESTILDDENQEIVNCIVNGSLCPDVNNDSSVSGMFLEEFEELSFKDQPTVSVNILCRYLKPVKVKDPFCELKRLEGCEMKLESLELTNADADIAQFQFENIEPHEVGNDTVENIMLEEVFTLEKEVNTCKLNMPSIDELKQEKLEQIPKDILNEMEVEEPKLEAFDINQINSNKEKVDFAFVHQQFESQGDLLNLESPCSNFGTNVCSNDHELPDGCEKINISDSASLHIISPGCKEELVQQIRDEESSYGDMLLMLLPDKNTSTELKCVGPLPLPELPNSIEKFVDGNIESKLDWDPLSQAVTRMKAASLSIVTVNNNSYNSNITPGSDHIKNYFKIVNTEFIDVDDEQLCDWKHEEKKLKSLEYITSYRKDPGCGIPTMNNKPNAPVGYHQLIHSTANNIRTLNPEKYIPTAPPPITTKMKSIPQKIILNDRKGVAKVPKDQSFQSPLDSFLLLRMGHSCSTPRDTPRDTERFKNDANNAKRRISNAPLVATVSAAKIKPMMHIKNNDNINCHANNTPSNSGHVINIHSSNDHLNINPSNSGYLNNNTININQEKNRVNSISPIPKSRIEPMKIHEEKQDSYNLDVISSISEINSQQPCHTNKHQPRQPEKIDVMLSEEFNSILAALDKDTSSLIAYLKDSKRVKENCSLLKLTVHQTRFLLKEEEKKRLFGNQSDDKDILCGLVCLHALTQVVDLVTHCNIPTACGVLKAINQNYHEILRNSLEPVRKKLISFHCRNEDQQKYHPKFLKLKDLILSWLKICPSGKIIVLFGRYFERVAATAQAFLSSEDTLKINLYPNSNAEEEEYMETFISSNVVLAEESEDLQTCPWKYFQFVIQFEYRSESKWHEIAYVSNNMLKEFVMLNTVIIDTSDMDKPIETPRNKPQCTVICNQAITSNKDLLVSLERQNNILLIPKHYDDFIKNQIHDYVFQPDIIINAKSGVHVLFEEQFESQNVEDIQKKLLSIVLKCQTLFVIIAWKSFSLRKPTTTSLVDAISSKVFVLKTRSPEKNIKILHAFSTSHLADIIRKLCDNRSSMKSDVWDSKHWSGEDLSPKEMFLLSYPFMNLMCAQIMLQQTKYSLGTLLQMSLDGLKNCFNNIPEITLTAFYNANNQVNSTIIQNIITDPERNACHEFSPLSNDNCDNNVFEPSKQHNSKDIFAPTAPLEDLVTKHNERNNEGQLLPLFDAQKMNLQDDRADYLTNNDFNKGAFSNDGFLQQSLPLEQQYQHQQQVQQCQQQQLQQLTQHQQQVQLQQQQRIKPKITQQQYYNQQQNLKQDKQYRNNDSSHNQESFQKSTPINIKPQKNLNISKNSGLFNNLYQQSRMNNNNPDTESFDRQQFIDGRDTKSRTSKNTMRWSNASRDPERKGHEQGVDFSLDHINVDPNTDYTTTNVSYPEERNFFSSVDANPSAFPSSIPVQRHLPYSRPFRQEDKENIPRQVVKGYCSNAYMGENRLNDISKDSGLYSNANLSKINAGQYLKVRSPSQTPDDKRYLQQENLSSISMSKEKKRRLGIERMPCARNGQTRLTFI